MSKIEERSLFGILKQLWEGIKTSKQDLIKKDKVNWKRLEQFQKKNEN